MKAILNLLTWPDYINPKIIELFEADIVPTLALAQVQVCPSGGRHVIILRVSAPLKLAIGIRPHIVG